MTTQQFIEWAGKRLNARDAGVFLKIVTDGRWTSQEHRTLRNGHYREEWEISRNSLAFALQGLCDARVCDVGHVTGDKELYKTTTIRLWNGEEEFRAMGLGFSETPASAESEV